jgi:hypothetical protein
MIVGLIVIVLVILLPVAYLVWRFKRGDESVAGGSDGTQLLDRERR